MPESMPNTDVCEQARRLRDIVDQTGAEFGQMPFFVRPMIRRGFAKRTGMDLAAWATVAAELATAPSEESLRQLVRQRPGLLSALQALAEHYRTAPERAARAMSGAGLEGVRQRSAERERQVRALAAALQAT
jgi:hypothetical protein